MFPRLSEPSPIRERRPRWSDAIARSGTINHSFRRSIMFRQLFGAAFAAALVIAPAFAHDTFIAGAIEISGGFSRATLPNAPVGGGYITITNTGSEDDALIAASSPVAEDVQLHQMTMEGDVMKMSALPDGIPVPAGATVTLEPGGMHLMMMGLKAPLVENAEVPVTLTFAKAGTVEITLIVGSLNADHPERGAN
jgi:copper(I)-binding protein